MFKRIPALAYTFIVALLITSLVYGGEVRKLGSNDLEWGYGTTTSAGGKTVTKIPYPFIGAASDNATWIDVRSYGTTATNTTVQYAIDNASSNDTVFLPQAFGPYTFSDNVTISKPLNIVSDGATVNIAVNKKGIIVASDNVKITGLNLAGAGQTPFNTSEYLIYSAASSGEDPHDNIVIQNNTLSDVGYYAMYLENIRNFDISHNKILRVNYGGIVVLSGINGVIVGNIVDNVAGSNGNGYPIQLTRQESSNTTLYPQSSNVTVSGNVVRNSLNWNCFGTHGGQRIVFTGNMGYGCKIGFDIGSCQNGDGAETYAPKDIVITGNSVDATGSTNPTYGVAFTGAEVAGATVDNATGIVSGNIIRGFGSDVYATTNGIYLRNTGGLTISGNTIIESNPVGIYAYRNNQNLSIVGNMLIDAYSDNNTTYGIMINGNNQDGVITGNTLARGSKDATKVNEVGLYSAAAVTGVEFVLSGNNFDAATAEYSINAGTFQGLEIFGQETYDPPSLADNAAASVDITVTGAALGDFAQCSIYTASSVAGVYAIGNVTAADTVTCVIRNQSGTTQNLGSGSIGVLVKRRVL